MKNELLDILRIDLPIDRWGHAMSAWFDVAEEMYIRDINIPEQWKFNPGIGVLRGERNEGSLFKVFGIELTDDELIYAGRVLERYTSILDSAGMSY